MSVPTYKESYEIYPLPTEAELEKAREIVAKGKKRAKLNRSKSPQEAWAKFDEVRGKIRESVNNSSN